MARPRRPLDAERRDRLMRRAREHFVIHGYDGASLSGILAGANFPRSSFYYFFGDKETLYGAVLADGISRLSQRLEVPDPDALTRETFWPTVLDLVDRLALAGQDRDLARVATLFHLPDAPPCAQRDACERSVRQWCTRVVRSGRELGVLDRELPVDLHVEVVWSVAVVLDRWLASHATERETGGDLTQVLLGRLLGAPGEAVRGRTT